MYGKIIRNDMRRSKLITATIAIFIVLASLLTSLASALSIDLLGAIDNFMLQAKTPHYMQMHSGDVDMDRLATFAVNQKNVKDYQVSEFLNIEGAEIVIGENTLAGSVQDNGLTVQNSKFDFLISLNGEVAQPSDGEIYVPIYYMREGKAREGDKATICGVPFKVAGFIRDSQMNPAMISSKRFLVSRNDFEKVRGFGRLENIIEFRFIDNSIPVTNFETAYMDAGIEANGPSSITYALFKIANASTDGIMIAVLVLVSVLVIIVTFLCIRFTLLAKIEEDYREIGVMKAIGIRVSNIKKLYLAKYGAIAAAACLLGFLTSRVLLTPLSYNIRLYMGESDSTFPALIGGFIGSAIIFIVIILYVNGVLSRFRKISAAQAIRFGAPREKSKSSNAFVLSKNHIFSCNTFLGIKDVLSRKKLYITMFMVLVVSSFIMVVPQNIYNTILSRNFMTYMGIGSCYMRIDIQQTDDIPEKTEAIASEMAQDENISKYTVLTSFLFDMNLDDGTVKRLKVELGDHSLFPIKYSKGRAPESETEIALSKLNMDDLKKDIGDEITLLIDGQEKQLTICGIYSDITNGGRTAKAMFKSLRSDVLWSVIPVEFHDNSLTDTEIKKYRTLYPFAKVSNIDQYIDQSFGSTILAIQKVSYTSIAASVLLTILVTLLFMKMLVTKDRYPIAVLKSLGFTCSEIRRQYVARSIFVLIFGVVIGTALANTLGELVGVALISSFGASSFHFEVNPLFAYLFSPIVITVCVYAATIFGISDIDMLLVSDHIKE